jgi:hypothetical protein
MMSAIDHHTLQRLVNAGASIGAEVDPEAKDDNDPRRELASSRLKEAHAADYDKWFRTQVQASIDDPRPKVSAEDARKQMAAPRKELRQFLDAEFTDLLGRYSSLAPATVAREEPRPLGKSSQS